MSTVMMGRCWALWMPAPAKAVLMSMADFADDQGYCWPAVDTLAMRTCLHARTVQRALRWLEEAGLVRVEKNAMRANLYIICPDDYVAAQADGEATAAAPSTPADCHPKTLAQRHPQDVTQRHPPPGTAPLLPRHSATLTVIEPSVKEEIPPLPPSLGVAGARQPSAKGKTVSAKTVGGSGAPGPIAMKTWLAECKQQGVKPIPPDDAVFAYCDKVGIDRETLALHWFEFKRRRSETGKRQRNWRQTFRNSVESNWYRLWALQPNGTCKLTTQGLQAQALMRAEADQGESGDGDAAE